MTYAERTAANRAITLADKVEYLHCLWEERIIVDAASFKATEGIGSWPLRRAHLSKARLSSCRFEFSPSDGMAGRPAELSRVAPAELAAAQEYLKTIPGAGGQTGHCELDLSEAFAVGLDGLRKKITKAKAGASSAEQDALLGFELGLDGLSAMLRNAAAAARGVGPDGDLVAASCERIASAAPETFLDASHLLWFVDLAVMHGDGAGLVVPGHIDRSLLPFFRRDLAEGIIDQDRALFLLECLYLHINTYISDGLAMSVMVGGRDSSGEDVTNELSYLCLEALRRTALVYPTVGVCWHEGTPEALTDLTVELISKGFSTPAFFGDETIQRGLRHYGVPAKASCWYINSTCVEITPSGSSNVWVASPYFSTCGILMEEIAAQAASGSPVASFDAFLDSYFQRLGQKITEAVAAQNGARENRRRYISMPVQSVFTRDCVARRKDINDGGATYNWVECSFVGLANLADSLMVLRGEVFDKRTMTFASMKALLDADFQGDEAARLRFLNSYPKYGNNNPEVDSLVGLVVGRAQEFCAKHKMLPDNSPFVPGSFCWIMHERLGMQCGATPDGRHALLPFADGGGPAQGREREGATAAALSTTTWDHSNMIGGVAFNMKFNRALFDGPQSLVGLKGVILTYLRRGGFETQVNVVDHEVLLKAKANPEAHRDLVVRIGGYTDYFVRLSPQMQDEVISRSSHTQI